jgi:hypothetical protein
LAHNYGQRRQGFNKFNKSIKTYFRSVSLMGDEVKERIAIVLEDQMSIGRVNC